MDENTRINNNINSHQDFKSLISFKDDEFIVSSFNITQLLDIIDFIKKDLNPVKRIVITEDYTRVGAEEPIVFTEPIDISNCTFNKKFKLQNCIFEKDFTAKHVEFKGETGFKKSIFKNKTRFHHTKFKTSIDFENTTFESLIDFYKAIFHCPQRFFLTDFLDVTIFSNVTFYDQVQFVYNKVKSESIISFENAICNQSIDISRSNFWCKLQFWGIEIKNNIPKNIWLYETDKTTQITSTKVKEAYPRLRESYRMIKHAFKQEGNNIESEIFHQKELFIFKTENGFKTELKIFHRLKNITLKKVWLGLTKIYSKVISLTFNKIWSKFTKILSKIETYITIWFNYVSNNFGQSWLRGIVFTLLCTLLFFIIFLEFSEKQLIFSWNKGSFFLTTKYFLQFLNIAKWDYSPFGIDMQNEYHIGYVILFIGRIFIGYGYYQTIQAFRRFGRN